MEIRHFTKSDVTQLYDLMCSLRVPEFYLVGENEELYTSWARNGLSVCAVENDVLIGYLLCDNTRNNYLYQFDEVIPAIKDLYLSNGIELANCAVAKEYRGNRLERKLIQYVLIEQSNKSPKTWFWCTAHKDNVASCKSIVESGFDLIVEDINFDSTYKHRNVYLHKS